MNNIPVCFVLHFRLFVHSSILMSADYIITPYHKYSLISIWRRKTSQFMPQTQNSKYSVLSACLFIKCKSQERVGFNMTLAWTFTIHSSLRFPFYISNNCLRVLITVASDLKRSFLLLLICGVESPCGMKLRNVLFRLWKFFVEYMLSGACRRMSQCSFCLTYG